MLSASQGKARHHNVERSDKMEFRVVILGLSSLLVGASCSHRDVFMGYAQFQTLILEGYRLYVPPSQS